LVDSGLFSDTFYRRIPSLQRQISYEFNLQRLRCVLKCVFSLSEEEAQVLAYLITNERGGIAKDIASALGRNPEVVRRALRSLYARSLVIRRPYPLRRGGRAYLYQTHPELVKNVISICERIASLEKNMMRKS
jgi:predicted transcriptional regulator